MVRMRMINPNDVPRTVLELTLGAQHVERIVDAKTEGFARKRVGAAAGIAGGQAPRRVIGDLRRKEAQLEVKDLVHLLGRRLRALRVTASARSAPDRTCGRPGVRSVNIIDTRPPRTSLSAGGTLR